MKKSIAIAIIALTLFSCNKEKKTITKIDPTTGDTIKIEVANKEDSIKVVEEMKAKAAITDSAGIYTQKFKLEKGKTYPFKTVQKQTETITAPDGKSEKMSSSTTDDVSIYVNDFQDGVYDLTLNFISKKTSQTAGGKTISVDTQKAAPKEEGLKNKWTMDKAMTGNKLSMRMDENGNIISIKDFDPMYNKISKSINSLTKDKKMQDAFLKEAKASLNEDMLKDQFTKSMMVFPKKGVKIGEKWTVTENASADGKLKFTTNYTLKSVENGVATVSISGGIPKQNDKQTQQGITRTVSSDLSQSGTMKFDVNSGWVINQNIEVKTSQKETLSDGKQTQSMSSKGVSNIIVNPK